MRCVCSVFIGSSHCPKNSKPCRPDGLVGKRFLLGQHNRLFQAVKAPAQTNAQIRQKKSLEQGQRFILKRHNGSAHRLQKTSLLQIEIRTQKTRHCIRLRQQADGIWMRRPTALRTERAATQHTTHSLQDRQMALHCSSGTQTRSMSAHPKIQVFTKGPCSVPKKPQIRC